MGVPYKHNYYSNASQMSHPHQGSWSAHGAACIFPQVSQSVKHLIDEQGRVFLQKQRKARRRWTVCSESRHESERNNNDCFAGWDSEGPESHTREDFSFLSFVFSFFFVESKFKCDRLNARGGLHKMCWLTRGEINGFRGKQSHF